MQKSDLHPKCWAPNQLIKVQIFMGKHYLIEFKYHTDQGYLYGLACWREMLIREDGSPYAIPSMSRRGNGYDNAVIESFFSTLKSEYFYSRQFSDIDELERAIYDCIVIKKVIYRRLG